MSIPAINRPSTRYNLLKKHSTKFFFVIFPL
jgi:hypothetical protein